MKLLPLVAFSILAVYNAYYLTKCQTRSVVQYGYFLGAIGFGVAGLLMLTDFLGGPSGAFIESLEHSFEVLGIIGALTVALDRTPKS